MSTLLSQLSEETKKLGIDYFSSIDYSELLNSQASTYQEHLDYYQSWIQQGYEAEMGYLKRGLDRRLNLELVYPQVQSVFCVLIPYYHHPIQSSSGLRYARYLANAGDGQDYHITIKGQLETLCKTIQQANPDFDYKICVDTSAVLERSLAYFCGLGWIGKNKLLIHPRLGSYFFIGVILMNQKLHHKAQSLKNYCGSCTRCLQTCPTQAFEKNGMLNSSKCISYLTLEKKSDLTETDQSLLKSSNSKWVAGCDLCQEACPFNIKPVKNSSFNIKNFKNYFDGLEDQSLTSYQATTQDTALSRIRFNKFKQITAKN
jgi:epoxyqueuosine reductase